MSLFNGPRRGAMFLRPLPLACLALAGASCSESDKPSAGEEARQAALVVEKQGSGTVTGLVDGAEVVSCGATCAHRAKLGFTVELRAEAQPGAQFVEWQGPDEIVAACGSQPTCSVTVPADQKYTVTAIFGEGMQTCTGTLVAGVHGALKETDGEPGKAALKRFLCRVDWKDPTNAALAADVERMLSDVFGAFEGSSPDRFAHWQTAQCAETLPNPEMEDTFDLKQVATQAALVAYEQCQYAAGVEHKLACSLSRPAGKNDLVLAIRPTGEGLVVSDIKLETTNANRDPQSKLPAFVTAYETSALGSVTVTLTPEDPLSSSDINVYAQSRANGELSCSVSEEGVEVPKYTLGGTIKGLKGSITLDDGKGYQVTRNADGNYTIGSGYVGGDTYGVSVASAPANQTCVVANGSGSFANENVTNVDITCTSIPERVAIPEIGTIDFMPRHTQGDRDFNANGPDVKATASIWLDDSNTWLYVTVSMTATETGGDHTAATGSSSKVAYHAPPGKIIQGLATGNSESVEYVDSSFEDDTFSRGTSGLVNKFVFVGDTDGSEAGTRTKVQVFFNTVYINLIDK